VIHVSLPNDKRVLGGTREEQHLYGSALAQHYGRTICWVDKVHGNSYHITFEDALADMQQAHALVAEEAYRGADSMWGVSDS